MTRRKAQIHSAVVNGEPVPIPLRGRGIVMGCCDCGLCHRVVLSEVKGKTGILRYYRAKKATARDRRRYSYPYAPKDRRRK